jgi:hypothetical protein
MTLTEQMKADGWIEHDGSGCLVPLNCVVDVVTKSGNTFAGRTASYAGIIKWCDIIAYKLEQPQ